MATYLVEAYMAGLDERRQRELVSVARGTAEAASRNGIRLRYLGSIFIPGDDTCFHLFHADSAGAVRRASGIHAFEFQRIVEVECAISGDQREGFPMAQYMVERHLAGFPADQLPAAAAAAKQKAAEISAEGTDVRYVRSTWIPATERCYCLFEASSRDAVEEAQRRANLPYEAIHEAAFLTADAI